MNMSRSDPMKLAGVYKTVKKNKKPSYRSSFTFRNKHISLGSFDTARAANKAYREALKVSTSSLLISDYDNSFTLPFEKFVSIVNFRDNEVYFSNPIYLRKRFFEYYFSKNLSYKFDAEDLFYYAKHKISRRGGHLFVADWGTQINVLNRYGIRSHAVKDRDYKFINGDETDFRYENIEVINPYYGVQKTEKKGKTVYKASILINGTVVIGYYEDEKIAAIAYNKAADTLMADGCGRQYRLNFIEALTAREYADLYFQIKLPGKIKNPPS